MSFCWFSAGVVHVGLVACHVAFVKRRAVCRSRHCVYVCQCSDLSCCCLQEQVSRLDGCVSVMTCHVS